jgi:hypothetical protein
MSATGWLAVLVGFAAKQCVHVLGAHALELIVELSIVGAVVRFGPFLSLSTNLAQKSGRCIRKAPLLLRSLRPRNDTALWNVRNGLGFRIATFGRAAGVF